MVRAPCCEKMGLKKGPWTAEEDHILINYIQLYGHGNWRALPKQAGLLRCGKSCRLRWTNYLRPDIKRGNFSREEEETIIELHKSLGNRWSAIAARLPGRTDNEIKNVWHTHLKKRLNNFKKTQNHNTKQEPVTTNIVFPMSPPQDSSSSDISSVTTTTGGGGGGGGEGSNMTTVGSPENVPGLMDDDFWSEVLSAENSNSNATTTFSGISIEPTVQYAYMCEGMEFWFDIFTRSSGEILLPELPEF